MIIVLPGIYFLSCLIFSHSWFDLKYLAIFTIIGGFYDICREIIEFRRISSMKNAHVEDEEYTFINKKVRD